MGKLDIQARKINEGDEANIDFRPENIDLSMRKLVGEEEGNRSCYLAVILNSLHSSF